MEQIESRIQKMWHVTFATIRPTIIIVMLLSLGGLLNVGFEKVYLLYDEQTYQVADVFGTYVYRRGLINMDYGYGTAVGLVNSIISLALLVIFNYIAREVSQESLW
jgi:putative aldouronate transport system permease protein